MVLPGKKKAWIALGVALLFHVLILSLQANQSPGPAFGRVWLIDALAPLEKLADSGVDGLWGVWDGYIALLHVRNENLDLRAENDRLRMEVAKLNEAGREAGRLRDLLSLAESNVGKTLAARVIGRDPSRLQQTITIDKGAMHSVKVNAAVISPQGVVGRVIATGRFSAVVQLLTDVQAAIGVLTERSRVQAVFKGTGGRDLELEYIDDDNAIETGDALIASGLDGLYPKGFPVGAVTTIGPRRGLFKIVMARPSVDVGRLEEVLVVLERAAPEPQPETSQPAAAPASLPSH